MARGHHSEHDGRRRVDRDSHNARIEDLDSLGFAANLYGEPIHLDPRMDVDRGPRTGYDDSPSHDEYEEAPSGEYGEWLNSEGMNPREHGRGLM